jgi:hypothetical protein
VNTTSAGTVVHVGAGVHVVSGSATNWVIVEDAATS